MGLEVPYTIVGVVGDARELGLEYEVTAQIYHPMARITPSSLAIIARGLAGPQEVLGSIRDAVHSVDPTQALGRSRMMDEVLQDSVSPRRTNVALISLFAMLALVLATIGVYSVVAYSIAQRTREFGIRTALGATPSKLVAMVSREMFGFIALGITIGLAGAWAGARVLAAMVYRVPVHDSITFASAATLLAVTATMAAVLPLRRVTRLDPQAILRTD
jgi:putative ABC transport system permease protein